MTTKQIIWVTLGVIGIAAAVYGLLQSESNDNPPPGEEYLEEVEEEPEEVATEPQLTIVPPGEPVPPDSNDLPIKEKRVS